jgi:NarL family two-component system sensor histidine kinase LiaS
MAADLEELIETRQQLSASDERNRLARDLHDSVKQQVFAISMNLGAAQQLLDEQPEAARRRLDTAFELARQSQQELSTIIQTLRPVQLEGAGLVEALAAYTERWQLQTGITSEFEARGTGVVPGDLEDALFRVAQEALSNVARHSGATRAQVTLTITGDRATLEVRDNGSGFATGEAAVGVGLSSMRERMSTSGGTLHITSDQAGTRVTASAPTTRENTP